MAGERPSGGLVVVEATGLRGLVVDWGGVLTGDMRPAVRSWAERDGVPLDAYVEVMRDWLGQPHADEARWNPVHALERGEIALPDFERRLAAELTARTGRELVAEGLLDGLLSRLEQLPDMAGLVRRVRRAGLRTALLSNSWGSEYPRDGWDEMFDVVVISGEVGMRKPEARIFEHALGLLGLRAEECVFVDDVRHNVEAAVALGMVGVQHTSYAETLAELEALLGLTLS